MVDNVSELANRLKSEATDTNPRDLAQALTRLVGRGDLIPGARLPTIRALADELAISVSTLNSAWRLLRESNVISTRRRGGSVISGNPPPPRAKRIEGLLTADPGNFAHDLSRLVPDASFLPDLGPAVAHATAEASLNTYAPAGIIDALREPVANEWPFIADDFFVTNGGYDALALLMRVLLSSTSSVAVEEPTSPRLLDIIDTIGAKVLPVTCDEYGPDPDALRQVMQSRPATFIFQTRAQSPTGYSLTAQRLDELVTVLAPSEVVIVENDSQPGVSCGPDLSVGTSLPDRTVHIHSYSKSHGPDLRIGVIGGAKQIVERVRVLRSFDAGWTSRLLQGALAYLLDDPASVAQVTAARETYAMRRKALALELGRYDVHTASRDGMALWLPVHSETATVAVLASRGIAVQPGSHFYSVVPASEHIRVSVSRLMDGFDELAESLAAARNSTWAQLGTINRAGR